MNTKSNKKKKESKSKKETQKEAFISIYSIDNNNDDGGDVSKIE